MAVQNRYVAAGTEHDAERERLRLLEAVHDVDAHRYLGHIGVERGWQCLEIGAGAGSITRHLAGLVGAQGHVVATDIDPRFLTDLPSNVEVRHHDVEVDPLEEGTYDLVFSRAVLMHLSDPPAALARIVDAVKPGGWLLLHTADFRALGADHPDHPAAEAFDRAIRAGLGFVEKAGLFDPFFGPRLVELVHGFDWTTVGYEQITQTRCGASDAARFYRHNFGRILRDPVVHSGAAGEADFECLVRALDDPGFRFTEGTFYGIWARKPRRS